MGLAARRPVTIAVQSRIQGLTPIHAGQINIEVCRATLDGTFLLDDAEILSAQERLVRLGEVVEPAGAAAAAAIFRGLLPSALLTDRDARDPLRVCVVVSGGNPDPEQIEQVRERIARGGRA
jgi:threonine dehydratase